MKKNIRTYMLLTALGLLLLGLALIIWPEAAQTVIVYAIGAVLCISGIVSLIMHFKTLKNFAVDFGFFNGAILIILGVLFLVKANAVIDLLTTVIGLGMILGGVCQLEAGIRLRTLMLPRWKAYIITSLVLIAIGIVIVIDPFKSAKWFTIVTGALLIVDAITWVWGVIEFRNHIVEE